MTSPFSHPGCRQRVVASASLLLATLVWLPLVQLFFSPDPAKVWPEGEGVCPLAQRLAARHLKLWTDPELRAAEIQRMRTTNAEWDFMGRTFFVLALANMAERDPAQRDVYLDVIDTIIAETLRLEEEEGIYFFLMGYARWSPWVMQPPRSVFVDGEIALMLGARRLVAERDDYKPLLAERVQEISGRMARGPMKSAESYPDECWTFCNTVALAALRIADVLDGTDHSDLARAWVANARQHLLHPETGLLISCYALDGRSHDGPEGSSIWMAAHCLRLVDPAFARDQYERARRELGRTLLGLSWCREWPTSWTGPVDVDSGPIVPWLEASAGSSGLALLAAASFDDREFLASLVASLNFAAFPIEDERGLRYAASNQVGDAVLLHALVAGPLWRKAAEGSAR